jgi:Na+/melibiose symporter-like transporter
MGIILGKNRSIFMPAILVAVLSILLILYYYYSSTLGNHPKPPQGGGPPGGIRPDRGGGNSLFTTFGTLAIISGAVSFSWFFMKKKLKSPSNLIKKISKIFYAAHNYTGWIALFFIAIHGTYYLITKLDDSNIFSGLAAFILILTLAIYGYLMKRRPNKFMRKTHFLLSLLWLIALVVHGGGTFIQVAAITLMIWAIIWIVELKTKQTTLSE